MDSMGDSVCGIVCVVVTREASVASGGGVPVGESGVESGKGLVSAISASNDSASSALLGVMSITLIDCDCITDCRRSNSLALISPDCVTFTDSLRCINASTPLTVPSSCRALIR